MCCGIPAPTPTQMYSYNNMKYQTANIGLQIELQKNELSSEIPAYSSLVRANCCNAIPPRPAVIPGPPTLRTGGNAFFQGSTLCNPCCDSIGGTDAEVDNYVLEQTLPYIQKAETLNYMARLNNI